MTAGVPPRVEAGVKAGLLDLVDRALEQGWTTARACAVLELDSRRCRRWQHRRSAGRLDDNTAGGTAVHAITPAERRAVLELFERWGDIDGGYRKLAHRGSYEKLVWVSPSTLYRVLAGEGLVLPARAQRTPAPARPLPDWIEWRRHQIWIYDITHFPRAGRVAYAILDVVTRKWLATLVTVEETATQVEVVFTDALDTEGLWPAVEARQAQRARHGGDSDEEPILLAMSDNGPQMRAGTTREFLAMCSIAARFGRPGTPTDQAWIETLFGHVKTEWPHLEKITDPNTLRAELDNARRDYNTRRLHASLGYVTPDDEHQGRGDTIRQAPPGRPQTGPPHPHRLPSQQQTKPAMNTPAQCGVIKPPKTDIYSEAPQRCAAPGWLVGRRMVVRRPERVRRPGVCQRVQRRRLAAALARVSVAEASCWNHTTRVRAQHTRATQAALASKSPKGRRVRPLVLRAAMWSSTTAWARMCASRSAAGPSWSVQWPQ